VPEAAATRAGEFGVARALTPEALLADPAVDLVLNLTPAPAHFEVSRGVLRAGKHLYSEKPLALSIDHGRELVDEAARRGLRLAVAPDTLLGAGLQTARAALDAGRVGTPLTAHGLVSIGARSERYFTVFRGPLLDLGPYHVGALLTLLGPVRRVAGIAQPLRPTPGAKMSADARTPDNPAHAAAVLEFAGGCLATLTASAELGGYFPSLTIWGDGGRLDVPDPNAFGGPVRVTPLKGTTEEAPPAHDFADNSRGIGVWDMAAAIAEGRPHRLSAELALHTLEVMLAMVESSRTGRQVELTTTCERPEPMPAR